MAMPRLPVKNDEEVVVEISDPTVSCDVVAIKFAPVASETTMELFGYDV